jgi:hypothetical protein
MLLRAKEEEIFYNLEGNLNKCKGNKRLNLRVT